MWVSATGLTGTGDIGIYNSSGTLVLNGGSGTVSVGTGLKAIAPVQTGAARTLTPGNYYVAITWNGAGSSSIKIGAASIGVAGIIKGSGTLATGGGSVLPSTIIPANIVNGTFIWGVSLNN